jgi:hypothetical protein
MLRDFLAYAADSTCTAGDEGAGAAVGRPPVPAGRPDPLRAEFAERLRGTGLVVHEAYGTTDYPIDLAVEDPERPGSALVAVETDGAAYAAIPSTRDRDRLRAEHLTRLGWMHVRVWSTDLFRDPARDVARVHAAVQQAVAAKAALEPAQQAPTAPAAPAEQEAPPEAPADLAPGGDAAAEVPQEAPPEEEFQPVPDEKARQRRVVRKRKRRSLDQTSDDTDAGWGEHTDQSAHDRWLQEQRPPHWGHD